MNILFTAKLQSELRINHKTSVKSAGRDEGSLTELLVSVLLRNSHIWPQQYRSAERPELEVGEESHPSGLCLVQDTAGQGKVLLPSQRVETTGRVHLSLHTELHFTRRNLQPVSSLVIILSSQELSELKTDSK